MEVGSEEGEVGEEGEEGEVGEVGEAKEESVICRLSNSTHSVGKF